MWIIEDCLEVVAGLECGGIGNYSFVHVIPLLCKGALGISRLLEKFKVQLSSIKAFKS